ncbi:MAG: hypothetical protein JWO44_1411 [Bacteroidetes bacterium]|nr:hypothetical protein [Bacteroidota bacterium]
MQVTKADWWTNKRLTLNKGLLVAGVLVIVFTLVVFYALDRSFLSFIVFPVGAVVFLIYTAAMNFLFILLEMIDRQFIKGFEIKRREIIFRCLFWLAIVFPFLYPVFILSVVNSGSE